MKRLENASNNLEEVLAAVVAGKTVQFKNSFGDWFDEEYVEHVLTVLELEWRIKPDAFEDFFIACKVDNKIALKNSKELMKMGWDAAMEHKANAGVDQNNIDQGSIVILDASGSTDDSGITSYLWTQTAGTAVTIINDDQAVASFTKPQTNETLTFQIEVSDSAGLTSTDTINTSSQANKGARP